MLVFVMQMEEYSLDLTLMMLSVVVEVGGSEGERTGCPDRKVRYEMDKNKPDRL